jgi:hypothetical protein
LFLSASARQAAIALIKSASVRQGLSRIALLCPSWFCSHLVLDKQRAAISRRALYQAPESRQVFFDFGLLRQ